LGFGWLDLGIVIAYLAGVTALGAYFRRQGGLQDYFLGGGATPWWAISLSIVATETSTLTIIGTPALAFAGDLGFLQLALGYILARFIISFLLLPQYFSGQLYTAYQYIERRFGGATRRLAAGLFLVTRALADGVRIWAIAIVVKLLLLRAFAFIRMEAVTFGELTAVVVVMLLTFAYTYMGGMKAVIWTDVAQFFIYFVGGLAALYCLTVDVGGWSVVIEQFGDKLSVLDFAFSLTTTYTFWSGILGGTFLTLASHGTDQLMVQRLLAAPNLRASRRALIASGFIVFAQFVIFLLIGVLIYAHYSLEGRSLIQTADLVFPLYIVDELPAGLSGLLVAGVLAAAMSTSSATLNSLAASTVVDFYQPRLGRDAADEAALLRRSRWTTVVWGLILIFLAMLARSWGPVLEAGLMIASITYGALLGLFLLGRLVPRATPSGAAVGMSAGLVVMLFVVLGTELAWTWYVLLGTLVTFAIGLLVSLLTPPVEAKR